jgi:hypothetical protein
MLWTESLDGLEASKEPVTIKKPDGSEVEIPAGNLRARAGFLREARQVLELQGAATGDLVKSPLVAQQFNIEGEFSVEALISAGERLLKGN